VLYPGCRADPRLLVGFARAPPRAVDARCQARADRGGHLGHHAAAHLPQPRVSHFTSSGIAANRRVLWQMRPWDRVEMKPPMWWSSHRIRRNLMLEKPSLPELPYYY